MIEEQPKCSSSREVEKPEEPMEPIAVTDVGDNREVEYERFHFEEV